MYFSEFFFDIREYLFIIFTYDDRDLEIETGIDVAKCIALGADLVAIAWPLLRSALLSVEAVLESLRVIVQTLRIAMFCIGAPDIASLKDTPHLQEISYGN